MTENQTSVLKQLTAGEINIVALDGRVVKSLSKKGWVKIRATKGGSFVSITAKGKKEIN